MTGDGPAVLVPEIARRAGVSQATLYRHFRDRYALVSAVIAHQLQRLEACAAASHPAAFRDLLSAVLHTQIAMRPLVRLVRHLDSGTRERYLQRLVSALAAPLRRAQEHGHVRGDLTPDDLALLLMMMRGIGEETDDGSAAQTAADRSIDLILDGVFRA